jgi:hypothetical protein
LAAASTTSFQRLGLGITDTTARRFEAFGDRLDVFRRIVTKLRDDVAMGLLPTFAEWTEAGIEFVRQTRDGENALGKFIAQAGGIGPILQVATVALASFATGFAIVAAINAVSKALASFSAASLLAAAAPLLAGAAVLALVLAAQDLYTYLKGGNSVIGELIAKFSDPQVGDGPIVRMARALLRHLKDIKHMLDAGLFDDFVLFEDDADYKRRMARRAGVSTRGMAVPSANQKQADLVERGTPYVGTFEWIMSKMRDPSAGTGAMFAESLKRRQQSELVQEFNQTNTFQITAPSPGAAAVQVRGVMDGASKQIGREVERAQPVNVR